MTSSSLTGANEAQTSTAGHTTANHTGSTHDAEDLTKTETADPNPGTDATRDPADNGATTTAPNHLCKTLPKHLIVLGDFTPAGRAPINDADDPNNSFVMLSEHLKSKYKLSSLAYKNNANATSQFKEMPEGTSDPIMVVIHSGSNDLGDFITKIDQAAIGAFDSKWTEALAALNELVKHFEDKSKFKGGLIFFINNIYNPFDDCPAEVKGDGLFKIGVSKKKTELMRRFNQNLRDFPKTKNNFHLVDLHPKFLGHGHNRNVATCPHDQANSEG